MTRRAKVWLVLAVLFSLGNLGGGVFAALQGDLVHAGTHAVLLLLGAYLVWRLAPNRVGSAIPALSGELAARLTQLEQSVDAVAIEVERVGEGQRFMTRLMTEKGMPPAPGGRAAEPIEVKAREAPPNLRRQ